MGRKKKNVGVKNLIRRVFKETYQGPGDVRIGSRTLRDGKWVCDWAGWFDLPEWLDATVRENLIWDEQLRQWCEDVYVDVIDTLQACFGEIEHWRDETRKEWAMLTDSCVVVSTSEKFWDDKRVLVPGWYNFTIPLPHTEIAIPDLYERVDGELQKVADARLLTDEEIQQAIEYWANTLHKWMVDQIEWERDHALEYFNFVGGSPFTDELWELKKYAGIRIHGSFSFPAVGRFAPQDRVLQEVSQ